MYANKLIKIQKLQELKIKYVMLMFPLLRPIFILQLQNLKIK